MYATYATIEDDFKTLNTAACVLHPIYKDALDRIQKLVESSKTLTNTQRFQFSCSNCEGDIFTNKNIQGLECTCGGIFELQEI